MSSRFSPSSRVCESKLNKKKTNQSKTDMLKKRLNFIVIKKMRKPVVIAKG